MSEIGQEEDFIEKQPTRRKIQADTTRKRIYEIAISLMEKKGFANTTIIEIAGKAGVSVGTFYNYFASKEEIFADIFKKADEYFERTVSRSLKNSGGKAVDRIILYFKYYARFNQKRGFHNIDQLYGTKTKFFTVKGRYMQELLKSIISEGQNAGELITDMTAEEITMFLFTVARGIVYDWCLHEGKYNLESKFGSYMTRMTPIFQKPASV